MAKGLEDVLGDRITGGAVTAKKGEGEYLERIEVTLGSHPTPDEDSVKGAWRQVEVARKVGKNDLLFRLVSGGGSSLNVIPDPSLTLDDLIAVTNAVYFERGAPITDTNIIRGQLRGNPQVAIRAKHVVTIETTELWPGFGIAPAYLDPPDRKAEFRRYAPMDAIRLLKRYQAWDAVPPAVRALLERKAANWGNAPFRRRVYGAYGPDRRHFVVMSGEYPMQAARKHAEEQGIKAVIVAQRLSNVEASGAAGTLCSIAREIEKRGRPLEPPCVLITGGELTVSAVGGGSGGRNQEFALASAPYVEGSDNIVVASADTDGTDGPTDNAGGIVDGQTMERAGELGIDVLGELRRHNSAAVLEQLGDTVYTGAFGTNVQDLRLVYIEDRDSFADLIFDHFINFE
jgi:glycerate-2-kinase